MSVRQEKIKSFFALSRRKKSIAKVMLIPNGTGKVTIQTGNAKNYVIRTGQEYFQDEYVLKNILTPLMIFQAADKYDVKAHVMGGGIISQSNAIKLCIAKALVDENYSLKPQLKSCKLLTQDKRQKERKKVGKYGARRSPQFTKR